MECHKDNKENVSSKTGRSFYFFNIHSSCSASNNTHGDVGRHAIGPPWVGEFVRVLDPLNPIEELDLIFQGALVSAYDRGLAVDVGHLVTHAGVDHARKGGPFFSGVRKEVSIVQVILEKLTQILQSNALSQFSERTKLIHVDML